MRPNRISLWRRLLDLRLRGDDELVWCFWHHDKSRLRYTPQQIICGQIKKASGVCGEGEDRAGGEAEDALADTAEEALAVAGRRMGGEQDEVGLLVGGK